MEELPKLHSKNYDTLRHEIRSGDLLLCSGRSAFSTLIQKATGSIWSHVAFILRLDAIDRIMVLESVESIGVRTIPLSNYVNDYNGTRKPYPGTLLLARHTDVHEENVVKLSRCAVDFLGYPYHMEEIIHIATRISLHSLGFHEAADAQKQRAFICSEYAHACFKSIGVHIDNNHLNFIAPADFMRNPNVTALCFIETEHGQSIAAN